MIRRQHLELRNVPLGSRQRVHGGARSSAQGGGSAIEIVTSRIVAGTVKAGLVSYYGSGSVKALAESTQQTRRAILERFRRTMAINALR